MKERVAEWQLSERDRGRKVEFRVGQKLELRLLENPTAGYRWRLVAAGEPVCSLAEDTFEPGRQPGRPGVHLWRFQIIASGSARIELGYGRSWQSDAPAENTFFLEVKSKG